MKHLIAERTPPNKRDERIGTIEALEKTVEMLRTTPVYSTAERLRLSPAHSCSETVETLVAGNNGGVLPAEDVSTPSTRTPSPTANRFTRRHILSAHVSLPDGKILEFRRNVNDAFELQVIARSPAQLLLVPRVISCPLIMR
ncbi:unnamed protein product [Anisakis simplex]|uniref:Uncharacterized protein n=1 Tax=Anisakis simplex TaxID=6269 RepID=A0A0M3KE02_ANISI|nr:unnamed protein product [Anisakis simplex]